MEKGKLIVMEGACDGVGKTTQYNILMDKLKSEGFEIFNYHFPSYGTKRGEKVEKFLRGEYGSPKDLSPYFINDLYADDRKETWYEIIKPQFEMGKLILLDRYTTSSIIYQSAFLENESEKLKFMNYVEEREYARNGIKRPDMVIFLTADFGLITRLRSERKGNEGISQDVFERDLEIQRKIYDTSSLACQYLDWEKICCDNDEGLKDPESIHKDIYARVRKRI